jgi:DNA-binding GntR family transcriptional regulator
MTRYEQTMRWIQQYITERDLGPGDRLPPEPELAQAAGVSLITLRRAMAEMAQRGLVRREQGRGTYVQAGLIDTETTRLGSLRATLGPELALTTDLLRVRSRPAVAPERAALRLSTRTQVWEVARLRRINSEPAIFEVAVVPVARAPMLDAVLTQDPSGSLYRHLAEGYGLEEGQEEQSLVVRPAAAEARRRLELRAGDPTVIVSGTSYTLDGIPFDAFRMTFDARRFAFHLRSTPQAGLVALPKSPSDSAALHGD